MIYAGMFCPDGASSRDLALEGAVRHCLSGSSLTLLRKGPLTLCYGKRAGENDMDGILASPSSVLLGRPFYKERPSPLEEEDFLSFSSQANRDAFSKIWGTYIYMSIKNDCLDVILDPTGRLPFFYTFLTDKSLLFASDVEIISRALEHELQPNWSYLCSYLMHGDSSAVQAPFQDIEELPPGCQLSITKHKKKVEPSWDPLSSYGNAELGQRTIVDVLQTSLQSLIAPYPNICVSLSGGLDSSSLVYCLNAVKREDQRLTAFNYFHGFLQSSNESAHARAVCQETGIELIELDIAQHLPFDPPKKQPFLAPNKPSSGLLNLGWQEYLAECLLFDGPSLLLSGHGSDHIFMRPPSKKAFSDYLIEKGPWGSIEVLKGVVSFYRDSLFPILRENVLGLSAYLLRQRLGKRSLPDKESKMPDWIKREAHQRGSKAFRHPIYNCLPRRVLPGKYVQVDSLYEALASIHSEVGQESLMCYPFLCEPVLDFALSIPSYGLFAEGYDRYPLRKAISDHFKTRTVWRRDKSQTTGAFQLGVKKNLQYVLDLCLCGKFAKYGLVDKEGVRQAILSISNGDIQGLWPFIRLASVEVFLKHWEEKRLCA